MRNATPLTVRKAIVRARRKGLTYSEIAELLDVGQATVNRVLRLQREKRSVQAKPVRGGNFSPISRKVARVLVALVAEIPDATVAELTVALVARSQIQTSRSGVQRALHRLGFSRKKSPSWQRSAAPPHTERTGGHSAPGSSR